jgi:hypothetical protein
VPPDAAVQRVRVEVLLKIGEWFVAPMEVRIVAARVPGHEPGAWTMANPHLPDIGERADSAAMECVADYLLGAPQTWTGGTRNVRDVIRRDAEQDMAIAREFGREFGKVPQDLWFLAEEASGQAWMRGSGAEWYLRFRDWIYRHAQP